MKLRLIFMLPLLVFQTSRAPAASVEEITRLISQGAWNQASQEISEELARTDLNFQTRQELLFQRDRMARMSLDFDKSREQVLQEARAIAPTISDEQFAQWENAGTVEFMKIDGTRRYFNYAANNLFRLNAEACTLEAPTAHSKPAPPVWYRLDAVRKILSNYDKTGGPLTSPRTWRCEYQLSVKPDAVPAGETVRAWLPFPHAMNRQSHIRLISSDPPQSVPANPDAALASVYLEKPAVSGKPTEFKIVFEYTAAAFHQPIDPARVRAISADGAELARFSGEEPPHIAFSDEVKKLSQQIVGGETNDWLKARRIFQWVSDHIHWASAREYSTLECLPEYALHCSHGDCGIQTMTFMTLCRLNGIPAHWETGWVTGPGEDMHDWCEIYIAPYGWIPADASFGMVKSDNEREKWFYLGGIDNSRLVVNTDYNQPLYPAKTFFRSEIVDFQRGEVEWRGGNLYFNQWTWNFDSKEIPPGESAVANAR
jgi:hypothetical protein